MIITYILWGFGVLLLWEFLVNVCAPMGQHHPKGAKDAKERKGE